MLQGYPSITYLFVPFDTEFPGSPDALLTAPKSAHGCNYFSLRAGLRLSILSEMLSNDSALVTTPLSPSFDHAMQQAAQVHGNDSMSICSMFSGRSNGPTAPLVRNLASHYEREVRT
jgi:hypothetical protein